MLIECLVATAFVLLAISMFFWRLFQGDVPGLLYWTVVMSLSCSALAYTLSRLKDYET